MRPDQSLHVRSDVSLAPWCTLGVGGSARYFTEATDEVLLLEALEWAESRGIRVHILGGGSNVVVADGGIDGLVVRIAMRGRTQRRSDEGVEWTAAAGEPWDDLVRASVAENLAGIECLSGIPGLVGATPIQNVGAYGQDVAETITAVRVVDRTTRSVRHFSRGELGFGYRDSIFKSREPDRYVVLDVTYLLRPGGEPTVRYAELSRHLDRMGRRDPSLQDVREAVLAIRRSKSMVVAEGDPNRRSCGSFFLNPVVTREILEAAAARSEPSLPRFIQPDGTYKLSAAWLIEKAGFLRGERRGNVGLSTRHTLSIVCHEGATAAEVMEFAKEIRERVASHFGVELTPEPNYWGP